MCTSESAADYTAEKQMLGPSALIKRQLFIPRRCPGPAEHAMRLSLMHAGQLIRGNLVHENRRDTFPASFRGKFRPNFLKRARARGHDRGLSTSRRR